MGLKIIMQPTEEQISLTEARLHLRMDDDGDSPAAHPDDAWLSGIGIPAARQFCEQWMKRALATQTLELALDTFPAAEIELQRSPIQSITSVKYVLDGSEQTLATNSYVLDDYLEPGWLLPVSAWPTAQSVVNAVKVRYVAGYSLPSETQTNPLPAALKGAMLLVLGALYETRENQQEKALTEPPLGAQALMLPYRLRLSMA